MSSNGPGAQLNRHRYLTSVERRLHRLERLFAQLLPDVDLEDALAKAHLNGPASPVVVQSPTTPDFNSPDALVTSHEGPRSTFSEAVPQEVDGFDWQEDFGELADGMAALSVEPKGTGYLGRLLSPTILKSDSDTGRVNRGRFLPTLSTPLDWPFHS